MDYTTMFPPRVCYRGQPAIPFHFPQDNPMSSKEPRKRRKRTEFTERQLDILKKTYQKTNYLYTVEEREKLSRDLNLSYCDIMAWFEKQRKKARRKEKQKPKNPESQDPTTDDTHRPIMATWQRIVFAVLIILVILIIAVICIGKGPTFFLFVSPVVLFLLAWKWDK